VLGSAGPRNGAQPRPFRILRQGTDPDPGTG
jgi:hypothetical protein